MPAVYRSTQYDPQCNGRGHAQNSSRVRPRETRA